MRIDDFDFGLPDDLIAVRPARPRSSARLLAAGPTEVRDLRVTDLPRLLRAGDRLVLNDTRVIPARLAGVRRRPGADGSGTARVEATLIGPHPAGGWRALLRPLRKVRNGETIEFDGDLAATVTGRDDTSARLVFNVEGAAFDAALDRAGAMPLPPYIAGRRPADAQDREDYQTVWASRPGAIAAPTASLHFDQSLLSALSARGVETTHVTLHVGAGTFLPVKVDEIADHRMHAEWGEVTEAAAAEIAATRAAGGRAIPVGTTALRLIEFGRRLGRDRAVPGRDRHLHHAGVSFSGDRRADDELPPAALDTDDACVGADGPRARARNLRACDRIPVPVLQLR